MRPTICLALLALLGACDANELYPPAGNGGGTGTGTGGDDPVDAGMGVADAMPGLDGQDAPAAIAGQLCRVDDVRFPLACPTTTSLAGINVREFGSGLEGTITDDTGAFSLLREPDGRAETSLDVAREHANFIPSLASVPLDDGGGAVDVDVPVIPTSVWNSLLTALAADSPDGSATLLVFVSNAGQPVAGADLIAPSGTAGLPFFDAGGPESFEQGGLTGDRGTAIVLGAPAGAGTVDFSILPPGQQAIDVTGVPVAPDAITVVNADLAEL